MEVGGRAPTGTLAADVRPLVRLSVTVIAEQTVDGRRASRRAGAAALRPLAFQDDVIAGYVNDAGGQRRADQPESRPAGRRDERGARAPVGPACCCTRRLATGLEGDFNRKGLPSAFAGRIGQRVAARASPCWTTASLPDRRGSLNIDDEGNPPSAMC